MKTSAEWHTWLRDKEATGAITVMVFVDSILHDMANMEQELSLAQEDLRYTLDALEMTETQLALAHDEKATLERQLAASHDNALSLKGLL